MFFSTSPAAEQGLGEDVTGRLRNDLKMVEQELVGRGSTLPPYPTKHGLAREGLRHETLAGFPESNVYYHILNPFVYLPTSTPYLSGILMGGGDDPGSLHAVFADFSVK